MSNLRQYCLEAEVAKCIFSLNYPDDCPTGYFYFSRDEACPHYRLCEVNSADEVLRIMSLQETQNRRIL